MSGKKPFISYREFLASLQDGILTPEGNCPVTPLLLILQGRWKAQILYEMCRYDTVRFGQLKKDLPDITSTMLAKSLRDLEYDGLEFEIGYLDSGAGDPSMRKNLRRWMPELAIVNGLPPEKVRPYADPEVLRWDEAMSVLRKPADHTDEEVFQALNHIGGGRLTASPVVIATEAA